MLVRLLLLLLLVPASAAAETVCISRDGVPFARPAPENERPAPMGTLKKRDCYASLGRVGERSRIFIGGRDGFQGEADVATRDLLHLLLDDIDLRSKPDEEPWGKVLSGTGVTIVGVAGSDKLRVQLVEGRVGIEFVVDSSDVFPAESWPEPDPDDVADPPWPEASLALPPVATQLMAGPIGSVVHATIAGPIFEVGEVLRDPARGQLRFAQLEQGEHEVKIVVASPTLWVEGWVTKLDYREGPPPAGWNPLKGATRPGFPPVPPRQIGSKPATLASAAKGDPVGELLPGTRITVGETEKGWSKVQAQWDGGSVDGWVENKRLQKQGKEDPVVLPTVPITAIAVGQKAVTWQAAEGHEVEGKEHDLVLSPDLLPGHVLQSIDSLRLAWAEVLAQDPQASGDVTVRLLVAPSGEVVETGLPISNLPSEALNQAVLAAVAGVEFPEREVKRKRSRKDPDLDWNVQVWLQLIFANSAG